MVSRKYVTLTLFNLLKRDQGHVGLFSKFCISIGSRLFVVSLSMTSKLRFCPGAFSLMSLMELRTDIIVLEHSHSECIGLHFVLCNTQKVGLSCSGTRFNRLTFVRRSTQLRDTGLHTHTHNLLQADSES